MSGACGIITGPDALVRGLFRLVDCRMDQLAHGGFLGLSGSALYASLVTGLLTILVAIQGYRMLLGGASSGRIPGVSDVTATILRIGFALALSGSWTAFDTVIFNVAIRGPGEIAGLILPPAGLANDGLVPRIQLYYDTIRTPPAPFLPPDDPSRGGAPVTNVDGQRITQDRPGMGATTTERESAANWFVGGTVGPLLAMRVLIAFLLALGPLAIVTVLFERSSAIFAAWLRTTFAAGLAWVGLTASAVLELEALDGPLTTSVAQQDYAIPGVVPILLIFLLIDFAIVAGVFGVMTAWRPMRTPARGATPADARMPSVPVDGSRGRSPGPARASVGAVATAPAAPPHSRVQSISAVLEARVRRERLHDAAAGDRDRSGTAPMERPRAIGLGTRVYHSSVHRRPPRLRMKASS